MSAYKDYKPGDKPSGTDYTYILRWVEYAKRLESDNERMRAALIKLRDCDWVITLPDRMDSVRQIAQEGLGEPQ